MAAQLTRLTHKVVIQLHPVAQNCTICSSRSRRPVRKLLDTPSCYHDTVHRYSYQQVCRGKAKLTLSRCMKTVIVKTIVTRLARCGRGKNTGLF